jgi:cytoskeletal protein CcmA (bactofilin family)
MAQEFKLPTETTKAMKQTVIEEGTEFKGNLKSSCTIVVNGLVEGELDAPEVTITRTGSVMGVVRAKKVRSEGTLSGRVEAAEVYLSGGVRSDTVLKTKKLEVKLGSDDAQLEVKFGECMLADPNITDDKSLTRPSLTPPPLGDVRAQRPSDVVPSADGVGGRMVMP